MDATVVLKGFGQLLTFQVRLDTLPLQLEAIEGVSSLLRAIVVNTELASNFPAAEKKPFLRSVLSQEKELQKMKKMAFKSHQKSCKEDPASISRLTAIPDVEHIVDVCDMSNESMHLVEGTKNGSCNPDHVDASPKPTSARSCGEVSRHKAGDSVAERVGQSSQASNVSLWRLHWPKFSKSSKVSPERKTDDKHRNPIATDLFHPVVTRKAAN